ncbi:hypothetical protein [Sorangium sp. So ce388]|uniref:hypothetical protein n=1 Tax=Sorangium sp. So ce388 TaxID=3133309 RepID=UPI003F5C1D78
MKSPDPGAALRLMADAAKKLDPSLTDEDIAKGMGVSHKTFIEWFQGSTVPKSPRRAAMRTFLSGLVDALPAAFEAREASAGAKQIVPFTPKAAS